jgi:penicillin-binding protein-related factor A (putative recombinase)
MTPEGRIKNEILSWLSSSGGFFFPIDSVGIYDPVKKCYRRKQSIYHIRGVSDILGIYKGRPIAIEVKSKTGVVSEHQKYFLTRFNLAGGLGFVARSLEEVKQQLGGHP